MDQPNIAHVHRYITKIKFHLKWILQDLIGLFSSTISWRSYQGDVRTLCFHGVCENNQPYINGRFIQKNQLRSLLTSLKQNCHFLTLEQFRNNETQPNLLNILLTFDDGYYNNKSLLLPILEELELPAVLFVTGSQTHLWPDLFDLADFHNISLESIYEALPNENTSSNSLKRAIISSEPNQVKKIEKMLRSIGSNIAQEHPTYCRLLSDSELSELNRHPLFTIANHTQSHFSLTTLDQEEVKSEFEQGRERVAQSGSNQGTVVALPYGNYKEETIDILQKSGAELIFSLDKFHENDEVIERFTINPFISIRNQLIAIRNGHY